MRVGDVHGVCSREQAISNGATGWLYFAVNEWLNFFVGKCTKEMPHCSEWSNHTAVATRAPSTTARTAFSPQGSGFASGDGLYLPTSIGLHSRLRAYAAPVLGVTRCYSVCHTSILPRDHIAAENFPRILRFDSFLFVHQRRMIVQMGTDTTEPIPRIRVATFIRAPTPPFPLSAGKRCVTGSRTPSSCCTHAMSWGVRWCCRSCGG